MKLYHSTQTRLVEKIKADGFRDGEGSYLTATQHKGVWFGDRPIDWNDAGFAEQDMACLTVEIPEDKVASFEWVEEGKGYREFLVPAEIVNRYPIVDVRSLWDT